MGIQEDSVDRAFALILADDRRKLSPDDDASAKRFWRQTFRQVRGDDLVRAVTTWLEENPRGRPNVGKIKELLRKDSPGTTQERAADDDDRMELRWAVGVLEAMQRGGEWASRMDHPHYHHTRQYADLVLKYHRYAHWHDAKAFLEPGWAPVTVTDVYL